MRTAYLLLPLALTGCNALNAERREAAQYVTQLDPLLHENSLLADQVLAGAANLYNGTTKAAEVQQKWVDDIVPLARHLADQAAVVRPPDAWGAAHDDLVGTWSDRHTAYDDIAQAITEGNRDQWDAARKASDDAKLREEKWFQTTNARLSTLRLSIDQFP